MTTSAPEKKGTVREGEYRSDGERLLRMVTEVTEGQWMVEDAKTEEWTELSATELLDMKVVRRARKSGRGE